MSSSNTFYFRVSIEEHAKYVVGRAMLVGLANPSLLLAGIYAPNSVSAMH